MEIIVCYLVFGKNWSLIHSMIMFSLASSKWFNFLLGCESCDQSNFDFFHRLRNGVGRKAIILFCSCMHFVLSILVCKQGVLDLKSNFQLQLSCDWYLLMMMRWGLNLSSLLRLLVFSYTLYSTIWAEFCWFN